MFHTIRYRGHHIHVSILDGVEKIQTRISEIGGRFDLQTHASYQGAQRAITRHVRVIRSRSAATPKSAHELDADGEQCVHLKKRLSSRQS